MTEYKMDYHLIRSLDELVEVLMQALKHDVFSFDYETSPTRNYRKIMEFDTKKAKNSYYKDKKTLNMTALTPQYAKICTISFAFDEEHGYVVPVRHRVNRELNLDPKRTFEILNEMIFSNPSIMKIAYNGAFESKFTLSEGFILARNYADPMHMAIRWKQLFAPDTLGVPLYTGQGLKTQTLEIFDHQMLHFEDVTKTHFDELDIEDPTVMRYSGEDSICALWLYNYWKEKLEAVELSDKVNGMYYGERPYKNYFEYVIDVECNVLRAIGMKQYYGIPFGEGYTKILEEASAKIEVYKQQVIDLGKEHGVDFGIKKSLVTKTMKTWLFETLGCPVIKKTDSGAVSFDKETMAVTKRILYYNVMTRKDLEDDKIKATGRMELERGVSRHPHRDVMLRLIELLTKYQKLSSLVSKDLEGRMAFRNLEDGRIHAQYDMYPRTGRFASNSPNNQNISKDKDDREYSVRNVYHPEEGYVMMCVDYSGQEVNMAGILYKEPNIINAIRDGRDLHTITANAVYHLNHTAIGDDRAPKDVRDKAKTTIFQLFYGGSPWSVYYKLSGFGASTPIEECERLFEGLLKAYPMIVPYQKAMKEFAWENGYVETILGYRRLITGLDSDETKVFNKACNRAYNTPIQGSSADMTKVALNNVIDWMLREKISTDDIRIIGSVHDEIVFEVRKQDDIEYFNYLVESVRECMEMELIPDLPLKPIAEPEIVDPHNIYNLPEEHAKDVCFGWGNKKDYYKWYEKVQARFGGEDEIDVF